MSSFRQSWMWPWLLLSLPAFGWFVYALATGFALEGDNAHIAIRTFDVFGPNPPLLGMPSTAGNEVSGVNAFHPGPLHFWLLAPLFAVSGWNTWGLLLGSLAINVGLAGLGLWAAWRIGSPWVKRAVVSTSAIVLIVLQFLWYAPWNPYPVFVGSMTLVVLVWGIVIGQRGWWPIAIFVGSLIIQTHLAGALIVVPLILTVVVLSRTFGWAARPSRREVSLTVLVLLVCWAAPLREALTNWPGNIGEVLDYVAGSRSVTRDASVSNSFDSGSMAFGLVLGAMSVFGVRRAASVLKRGAREGGPTDNQVVAVGLLITSMVTAVSSAGYFIFGSSRGLYLLMFCGVWLLQVLLLKPRSRIWWTQGTRMAVNLTVLMAIGLILFGFVGAVRLADARANMSVREATRELVEGYRSESIVVHQIGGIVEISPGMAVVADLVLTGHDVYFTHFDNRSDYDTQRRIERAPDSRLELFVVQQNADSTWPDTGNGAVIDSREIDLPHWGTRVKLVLVDQR